MRRDLSPGQRIAQAVHAAFEYAVGFPDLVAGWHRESNFLVVLECPDDMALLSFESVALSLGLKHKLIREPDYPEDQQVTAIVLEPGKATSRMCSNLPLAFREVAVA